MLYEFAIEPVVLVGWDKCRNVLNLMGFQHGRVIAAYPSSRRWSALVLEACKRSGCGEREFARITEKLRLSRSKFVHAARNYDDGLMPEAERWLNNALLQLSSGIPFHALIAAANATGRADVVAEEDVDDSHPLLRVAREQPVLREANPVAAYVRVLVRSSNSLILIDPHFEPWLDRWWPVVKACLGEAADADKPFNRVEIHTLDTDYRWAAAEFERRCRRNAVAFLPRGFGPVRVVRWRKVPGGSDDFHDRYLLTDRGGYKFGKGLDEELGVTQPVGLLDDPEWERLWAIYRDGTPSLARDCEIVLP
jgi:hypothetical protein